MTPAAPVKKVPRAAKVAKRGPLSTMVLMVKAFFGSLFDPKYSLAPKKMSNVHGIYDDSDHSRPARPHIGASDGPTSFGTGGG